MENKPYEFSMLVIHDNGAMEKLELSDSPLSVRLKLGPSEVKFSNIYGMILFACFPPGSWYTVLL